MKHIYTLIIALFILVGFAQAQVTIYHENMSPATLPAGLVSLPAAEWEISNQTPSNIAQASGNNNIRTAIGTANGFREKTLTLNNQISTRGYKGLLLSWIDYRTSLNPGNSATMNGRPVRLFYSDDKGASFKEITGLSETVVYSQWVRKTVSLPVGIENKEDVRFRWVISNDNKHSDYFAIDDITLIGMPEEGVSTLDWSKLPKNEDPFATGKSYTVDSKIITFTKSVPAGVELTAKVVDSLFQAPAKTLTLIQKRAKTATGSTITIKFNQPVADLSFALFDVDQVSGQFQDRVIVTAKGELNQIVMPSRNKVIHTSKNRFTSPDEILGVSGADVPSASNDADVRIAFGAPVVEVTLAYYNSDAAAIPTADGQQGIGIHNLTWRFEQPINPLPVELTSFKGQRSSHGVSLAWATASELDNKGFEVQTSADGRNFKTVAFVESKVGTTLLTQKYSFSHKNPVAGTNYYRLRQVDFDGSFDFSKVIAVQYSLAATSSVYPTMASEQVTVNLLNTNGEVTVMVSDMNGRQITQVLNPSERELVLPVQHLQNGMYFVTVVTGEHKEVFRFLKR